MRTHVVFSILASCVGTLVGCSAAPPAASESDALTMADLPVAVQAPAEATFDQHVDHHSDAGTFKQRYWIARDFATGPDSPVILSLCGEGVCTPQAVTRMADSAKVLGATVVAIEHRYYGKSKPFAEPTPENLKFLTIDNALEDLATFQVFARETLNLRGKWIVAGRSYAGTLAAFFREKHPEAVVGAWASSAPVDYQLSFSGYDEIAGRALGTPCRKKFQRVLAAADAAYAHPADADALARALFGFQQAPPKADLLNYVSGSAMGAAQSGGVRALCSALDQGGKSPLDGFIGYLNPPLVPDGDAGAAKPPPLGPQVRDSQGEEIVDDSGFYWFYQVCSEVGLFQVASRDRSLSVMSELNDEEYFARQCDQAWGRRPDVAKTHATYFEPLENGEVSHVLFVNGSLDPWSALSFTDTRHVPAGLDAFVVANGIHGEDLHNLVPDDLLGVFQAHVAFHDLATKWLAQ